MAVTHPIAAIKAAIEQILFDGLVGAAWRSEVGEIDIDTLAKAYARCVPVTGTREPVAAGGMIPDPIVSNCIPAA